MSQHVLDGAQVGAGFEQVCGKGVPEAVWGNIGIESFGCLILVEEPADTSLGDAAAACVEEECFGVLGAIFVGEFGSCLDEISADEVDGGVCDGDFAFLLAFSEDADPAFDEVDAVDVDANEL